MMKLLRGLYDWTMDKAVHPHAVWWLGFFSFIEASFFPIPPHPLLGLMCLAAPHKAIRLALVATLSSVAGALLGYAIGWGLYDTIGAQIIGLLGLTDSFPVAACYLREYDVEAILIAGATPVPFKLLTITAGFVEMALIPFVLASLAARAMIFMTVGILFRMFGAPIKRLIDEYLGTATALFVVLVVGGFIALSAFSGGSEEVQDKCEAATLETLKLS